MRRPSIERAVIPFVLAVATASSFAACAPDSDLPAEPSWTTGAGGASGQAGSGTQGGDPTFVSSAGPGGDGGLDPDAACGLITEEAKGAPLNLYIALDKSSSMKGTNWDAAKAGLLGFVADPSSGGIKVALNFFPLPNESTCDQFAYKEPAVAYGELPQGAQAVTDAMNAQSPNGFSTPIYPALGGAILKGIEVTQNNPGDVSAVLLVTDGLPVGPAAMCGNADPEDPQAIADLAAKGATMYGVRTFVIGLPGIDQAFANKVAAAGGTDKAILVTAANASAEFQEALSKVRGEALPCEYDIPSKVSGGEVDPGFVNVLLSLAGKMPEILPQDPSCAGAGWTYDDPVTPTKILFCDASCKVVKADYKAKVQILLGCKTEVAK